ncbi:KGP1 kinase, partial [Acromyrmex heyeri]
MDEGTKYRVPIGDACVSMRVCFDSLCFSSSQQPRADEEDDVAAAAAAGAAVAVAGASTQLPTDGAAAVDGGIGIVATTATTTQITQVPLHIGAGGGAVIATMGTPLRELQELLRIKDERIAELETIVCCRDAEIQELRSHLDKFLSILPFSAAPPLTPTKPRTRDRAQGISAEPPLQELAPLAVVDKSDRRSENNVTLYLIDHKQRAKKNEAQVRSRS